MFPVKRTMWFQAILVAVASLIWFGFTMLSGDSGSIVAAGGEGYQAAVSSPAEQPAPAKIIEPGDFQRDQERFPRVRGALAVRIDLVRNQCVEAGLLFPPRRIYLQAFKRERQLAVWGQGSDGSFVLLKTYPVCSMSGDLGPKLQQGDSQVPEGCYHVDRFNPASNFHLSLGLDYPNETDRQRSAGKNPGGDIFIHGACVSIGCLAMGDAAIEELYTLAVLVRDQGQRAIPVHIFPGRMDEEGWKALSTTAQYETWQPLWEQLRNVFRAFDTTRRLPVVGQVEGVYLVRQE
ncbi:L,D-transpeptidase family protein [bacterium]|nr:L,D-transpeptidase family protein [candidate division CSSED10-310 bacterium]